MTQQNAPHPRMHGLTHVAGGPDPIPGLLPSAVVGEIVIPAMPGAYYKLNETSGDWADSSGADRDAGYIGSLARGVASPLDEDDGALCVTVDGEIPTAGSGSSAVGSCTDPYFEFSGLAPFTISAFIRPSWVPPEGSTFSMGVCGNVPSSASSAEGWGLFVLSDLFDPDAPGGAFSGTPARVCFRRSSGGAVQQAVGIAISAGEWWRLTGVFDGTTMGLWLNETQVGSSSGSAVSLPAGVTHRTFLIGACGIAEGVGGGTANFLGEIDSVLVWDRALTIEEINGLIGGTGEDTEGWVPTLDEDGNPFWGPPGIEVEYGGGTPDAAPVPVSPPAGVGGPASPDGWDTGGHAETAVLYDATPGRFDVPSMKWVRVPFANVRIYRTWETEPGVWKSAWLAEDRGLTEQARNGILHIGAGMEGGGESHDIRWWFTPEWPFLDWARLPNFGDPEGVDAYVRAGRGMNLSTGTVLRSEPGSSDRRFFEWGFFYPADGIPDWVDGATDNPYPIYPVDAARPLRLPDPYPKLSEATTAEMYAPHKTVEQTANLTVGDNLCLQVWQDSPWPLRFSTDTYRIPYPGLKPDWIKRPYLSVAYLYDPDTIDHATGALLA